MKAVVFDQHGGIEVLQYRDIPEPDVSPNDVLVRVKATACNYNDIWARRGMPGLAVSLSPYLWERCRGRDRQGRQRSSQRAKRR